jgi:Transposase DDE domain
MATSFFSSRKRCCEQCLTRTVKVDDQEVTEYYHRGVVCHLIGQSLAVPLDVELQRPGEGEVPAAKRLLERVFANYSRYFDAVVGDGLYFEAPFFNFCLEHNKHVVAVIQGDHRLLLQDAEGLFSQRDADGRWVQGRRTVQYWDEEGFTSCEGISQPLRVLHTQETERRRERIAGQWKESEKTSSWYWATTATKGQLPSREFWQAGHWRWDIENGCFNTTSTHWGLDHVFKHDPTAIVNFILTLFLAFVLLQCFWRRNLKPPFRDRFTLIALAAELYAALGATGHQLRPCASRPRAP